MEIAVSVMIAFVVFGAIGMLIGQRRGRLFAGLMWAMILGPLGWLIVLLGPDLTQPKSAKCPHCSGIVPIGQGTCNHCANAIRWIHGKAYKPSRAA